MKTFTKFFTKELIIKIGAIVALIVAASTKQQYNFYVFIHWFITISFIYFAYKSYQKNQTVLLVYFAVVAILFNPFLKFTFQKNTWHIIDYIIAFVTTLTVIYDLIFLKKEQKNTNI